MPAGPRVPSQGETVEELLVSLKNELLELFDYSDVKGNRTVVRADLAQALDGAREEWHRRGGAGWRTPRVRYGALSDFRDRLEGPLRALTPGYLRRRMREKSLESHPPEVDGFGMDPAFAGRAARFIDFLYERYWRVEAQGMDHVPHRGASLLVANHSGTLPFDAMMISAAVQKEHASRRPARFLVEDIFMTVPFVAPFLSRIGLVRASQENAARLLHAGEVVGVFPEGAKGIGKYYRQRYQLQRFGRGGFVRLALESGAPLIPVAVVGAEETMPTIGKLDLSAKALGLPYLPITPLWPLGGPLGLLPFPTKWYIRFGKPIEIRAKGPGAADDELFVNRIKEETRATIQEMLYDLLARRKSVWWG